MKTVRLLLAAIVISCPGFGGRAAEIPTASVDQYSGYKSFKLGTRQAELIPRLVPKKTTVTRMVPWQGRMAPQDFVVDAPWDPNGTYEAVTANTPEGTWAGCSVQVKLGFAEGILTEVYVSLVSSSPAEIDTFKAAWFAKFAKCAGDDLPPRFPGAVTIPLYTGVWVGSDTCVSMCRYSPPNCELTFWSKGVDASIAKIRTEKARNQAKKAQQTVEQMAKEL